MYRENGREGGRSSGLVCPCAVVALRGAAPGGGWQPRSADGGGGFPLQLVASFFIFAIKCGKIG
jgi:hypothetical protein